MRTSKCVFSAATALHRVFVVPIEYSRLRTGQQPHLSNSPRLYIPRVQQRSFTPATTAREERPPRDNEIDAEVIHIVQDNGRLSPPLLTANVLRDMDPTSETLIMVKNADSEDPTSTPICRVMLRSVYNKRRSEKSKKRKPPASSTVKKLELNWAIDGHDLGHRLDRVREFLEKGWRVEIVIAPKRKGRRATLEEAERLLDRVRETVGQVEGAKERKAMEGRILAQVSIFLEGALQK